MKLVLFIGLVIFLSWNQPISANGPFKNCAFVTLIYPSEHYISSAAVLGYSIQYYQNKHPFIALIPPDLSNNDRTKLNEAGWIIQETNLIDNPNLNFNPRFHYVYTKLKVFEMVQFDRIVYLDADTLLQANIDELCSCDTTFGAVLRGDFFNTGVFVATPSLKTYNAFYEKYKIVNSYTTGDQGFFNSFFWDVHYCPYHDPWIDAENAEKNHSLCMRIPSRYNGDVAFTVFRDNWIMDPYHAVRSPSILHFSLGPVKPWHWWSYPLVREHWKWWDIYRKYIYDPWIGHMIIFNCLLASIGVIYYTHTRFINQPKQNKIPWYFGVFYLCSSFLVFLLSMFLPNIILIDPFTNAIVTVLQYEAIIELIRYALLSRFSDTHSPYRFISLPILWITFILAFWIPLNFMWTAILLVTGIFTSFIAQIVFVVKRIQ